MMTTFVDTHAHLDLPEFENDLDAVLDRAAAAGVGRIITAGVDLESARRCLDLARRLKGVAAAAGVHPHHALEADNAVLKEIESIARDGAVAIGEIGLDFYRDRAPRRDQITAFRRQLDIAARLGLPVIVHSRNALDQTLDILEENPPPASGVIHCFSGGPEEARRALDVGFFISFAGPITYPGAEAARQAAASAPLERILLETDSPFLAPQSMRGKRNEPAFVVGVARTLAEIHGLSLQDVATVTCLGAETLFGKF